MRFIIGWLSWVVRRYKEKKEEAVEPEADPERDQRTVFAYQISLKAGERDVYEFFSRAGKVRDVQLIMDRNTRRSKGVFESFGTVELVQMPTDPGTGNCKGYAFVQFARLEDAKAAQNLNGQLEIAGRVIKVSAVTDQAGMQNAGANIADFDDDEGSGLSLNAHSRALLMQKLDRTGAASRFTPSSLY
ncbi:hypothetical protein CDL12_08141 [Handroanthus impetiginosus]|uniref:RRM domain-containing protein n=1 Tax=Handroanthus impetiginosus TaxID=429701 RepID=A0A2G9HNP5_9LAMI|nr:hypothetical protein CDL12_08141 [Handroanthus impetiginosus]